MAEREVVIKISAKNLTEGEFKKARAGLAGLGSGAKGAKGQTTGLQRAFTSFGKAAPGALKIVTGAAAATGAAIAGVTAAVIKLGQRGAMVADVKDAFNRLSASAGETGAVMLGALSAGVKGTVSNFELMRLANTALGAGLLDTSEDARTMAEGARLLAKRTGGDTAQAFNTLTTAMASGRTAQLKQLGLFVDNKKAVEDYAAAQGKSVSSLTDADRAAALQVATLQALRVELKSNAPPLADFGELIEQGRVGVKNLVDGLAVMISQSPPLIAGMGAVKDMIGQAFGGDQQGLILGIVNVIERAGLMALEFGQAGISAAGFLYKGFAGIKVMVLGIGVAFATLSSTVGNAIASILEAGASVPVLGAAYKGAAGLARTAADSVAGLNASLKAQVVDASIAAAGNDAFGMGLGTLSGTLETVKNAYVNAGFSQQQLNQATAQGVILNQNLGGAVVGAGANIEALAPILEQQRADLIESGATTALYGDTVSAVFNQNKTDIESYGTSINAQSVLATVQGANIAAAFERMGISTRAQLEETAKQAEKDYKTIEGSGKTTAGELDKAFEKYEEARRLASGETAATVQAMDAETVAGAMGSMAQLGGKFKIFAIGQAIISTYLAAAKSFANLGGWPMGLVGIAASIATGLATVAKIKSQGFQTGTMGLDYQDFGTSSSATLHGSEAVIPRGGGHQLADEIAGALARKSGPTRDTDALAERFERIGSKLDSLPRAIQRAVRDGMLLA
ncbi:MAG: hypothetical protein GY783_02485 [Gammaproteobacteria bacterium]|nr:hypothetical protein [Gammaproteobacteria bacterium]